MREIADQLIAWHDGEVPFAVATVVRTFSSAPRSPGAVMAVSATGEVVGSISGGCVEAAVVELAESVLRTGIPAHQRFGVSDDDAFAVGLTCGGSIEVFVERASHEWGTYLKALRRSADTRTPTAMATVIAGSVSIGRHIFLANDTLEGTLGSAELDRAVLTQIAGVLHTGTDSVVRCGGPEQDCLEEVTLFVRTFAPKPHMIVFGAIDFASSLVQIGKMLGYFVTLCDARPRFATRARFPDADEIVIDWPHRYLDSVAVDGRTVLCLLTHDTKFDIPLLEKALRLPAAYIGAMGSRRATSRRESELRERGLTDVELSRLHAPIGLDIGGRTPFETAVSIAAEIICAREGRSGRPLKEGDAAIHAGPGVSDSAPPFMAAV
ncbi:XdhC family protein [Nocardia sp. R7R-8]|uniref:XdhC family protein n=1 Tax=Nocardia sp. R7R-8 TaxID=3459304 RepID=UPI00403E00BE